MIITFPRYIADRHCGYCNDSKTDYYALESEAKAKAETKADEMDAIDSKQAMTIGCSIIKMTCLEYDELINKGFRRSGTFLYKNDLLRTCCRLYTIRTNQSQFKLNKKQRKVVNRFIHEICPDESVLEPVKKNQFSLERLIEAQLKSTSYRTSFEPSSFTKEKFELYKKYQVGVHNDDPADVTEKSFKRFLCDTPFSKREMAGSEEEWRGLELGNWTRRDSTIPGKRVGPTHECYYLNDKLIAISVLDFLPSGVSSIYFIWDPDYAYLSLGTLSGIKEIQMCDKLGYEWYYLGYYIEDCPKMVYKGQFGGQLLDVCNEAYYPLEKVHDYIKNGRLFVIGDKTSSAPSAEISMLNNDYPEQGVFNEDCYNAAEDIYGRTNDGGSDVARNHQRALLKKYKVDTTSSEYMLPAVVPGVIPLSQILQWFRDGTIGEGYTQKIGGTSYRLSELSPVGRGLVIDCIRLFGLDRMNDTAIAY
ncbi:uncharacterized protein LODBEIA_P45130 [Lodderomyces beijingensis]|uniref:arginyltransferase n=1 Tax=Lodderomyces beijingensis TaxID=1775926 RepID=A0ABP0ZQ63_9ASCO